MTRLLAAASVTALLAFATPALAQSEAPIAPAPIDPTGTKPAAQLATADQAFVEKAAKGGMAEVELGRVAQEKASDQEVKELAKLIVREHEQANQQLRTIAQAKGVQQLPQNPDGEHLAMRDQLQAMSGAEFDRMYIEGQVADHDEAVALFEQQAQSGQDPELKAFASETLPKIQAHTERLKQVAQRLGRTPGTQATGG